MTGRRSIVGLCMLCALVFSAFAAQSASAAGTTAFTCAANGGAKDFSDAHCKTSVTPGTGSFGHVAITTGTSITASNETTGGATEPTKLHSIQAGVEEQLTATGVSGTGTMENSESGGVMSASGSGSFTYTGVTVTKPAGKGCKVYEDKSPTEMGAVETVKTKELKASTVEEKALKFEPAVGEVFATFYVTECTIEALNGTYEVKGSVKSTSIEGATTRTTALDTTNQNTLKVRGQKAGIDGVITIKGANGNGLTLTK